MQTCAKPGKTALPTDLEDIRDGLRRLDRLESELRGHVEQLAQLIAMPGPLDGAQIRTAGVLMGNRSRQLTPVLVELDRLQVAFRTEFEAAPGESPTTRRRLPEDFYTLSHRIGRVRQVLNQWPHLLNEIKAQAEPEPRPLFADPSRVAETATTASDRVFDLLHGVVNRRGQSAEMEQQGAHADIPRPMGEFLAQLQAARRLCLARGAPLPLRFLDVGCGAGFKVLAARQILEWADGLELDAGYIGIARGLLDRPECGAGEVIEGDALKFGRYDRYDVIYLYQPFRDTDRMAALERRIADMALPGTVLIAPYRGFATAHAYLGCSRVGHDVYLVGLDNDDTAEIAARAEQVGPAVRRTGKVLATLWEPVLAALERRGVRVQGF